MLNLKMKAIAVASTLLATAFSFACGTTETEYVYGQGAGTVSGNVWYVSEDYETGGASAEGLEVTLYADEDGDGNYETNYYADSYEAPEGAEWDPAAEGVDMNEGTVTTEADGSFEAPYVEEGEYLVSITDPDGTYADTEYVVEVGFGGDVAADGSYAEEAVIEQPLGVAGADTGSISDGKVRIVLSWLDGSDYDSYWSFPRYNFHGSKDDITSPYYPDHKTQTVTTAPTFCDGAGCGSPQQGLPGSKFDEEGDGWFGDASDNPMRFLADSATVQTTEDGSGADDSGYADIADTTVDWTGEDGARGLMYWDFLADYQNNIPAADAPYTYSIKISGTDTVVVGLDKDSYYGTQGPETIFLGGIPNNNAYDRTSDNAFSYGTVYGDEQTLGVYEVGQGSYSVFFYASEAGNDPDQGATNPSTRFDSSFATSKAAVNIYAKNGNRMWTFVVPDGNPDEGATLPYRAWRPFESVYEIESDGTEFFENIRFIPAGFANDYLPRNGVGAIVANMNTRSR